MTGARFFALMGAVMIAPHVSPSVSVGMGAIYVAVAAFFAWRSE